LNDIPRAVHEAFYIAGTGRYGPVLVDIPRDLLAARGCSTYSGSMDLPGYTPVIEVDMQAVRAAADAIRGSRKPLIIAGGGVVASGTGHLLKDLAELCGAPVVFTLMGLGAIPYDHPLALGMIGMHGLHAANRAAQTCDLVVGVGTRFDDRAVGVIGGFASKARVIHIDIDPAEIDKNVRADIALVGDARLVLPALLEELKRDAPGPGKTVAWQRQVKKWAAAGATSCPVETGELKPQHVIEAIWDEAGDQAIVATEVGQHQMWAALHSRLKAPRRFITSGGLGTMGFGFPAAIGAKVAKPGAPVVLVAGDGSFQMNMQELATAAQYDIPIVVCVINNGGLGMVRQWQTLFYGQRHFAVDFSSNPDFVKIAEAYGLPGLRVTTEDGIRPALRQALASGKTFVIDFLVAQQENVFPMTIDGGPVIPIRRKKQEPRA
jgi:acetolactate synthase-1/2/3 large subunit